MVKKAKQASRAKTKRANNKRDKTKATGTKASTAAKAKTAKKVVARKRASETGSPPTMTNEMHSAAFLQLVAHAHAFQKLPLCYKQFPDGSAQVCKLMPDGTYGDCETFLVRPVPGPRCG